MGRNLIPRIRRGIHASKARLVRVFSFPVSKPSYNTVRTKTWEDTLKRALITVIISTLIFAAVVLTWDDAISPPPDAPVATPPPAYDAWAAYAESISSAPRGGTRVTLRHLLDIPLCNRATLVSSIPEGALRRMTFNACGLPLSGLYAPGTRGLIMVIHGTASTPEAAFGLTADDYMHGIGRTLNDAGYAVFAPEILTEPYGSEDINGLRNAVDKRLRAHGQTLVGNELSALAAALRWHGGGAVYGISLGGYLAFHLCAITDAQACGVSGYIEDRAGKLTGEGYPQPYWQVANADYMTVPGYLEYFDDVQIARLIDAPLYVETGSEDPRAAYVGGVVEAMRAAGVDATSHVGQGGHETYAEAFMEWLASPNGDS